MAWGEIFRAVAKVSFIVGPILGLIGALGTIIVSMASYGTFSGLGFAAMFSSIVGMILGLVIASPVCLAMGSVLVRMAAADERWMRPWRWIACGCAGGVLIGIAVSLIAVGDPSFVYTALILAASAGALGALGSFLCRRMIRKTLDGLHEVDATIFE